MALDLSVFGPLFVRALVHRRIGIDPLIVLLEAVEDVRLADEAFGDEGLHVHDRRGVAEGQADLRLEVFGRRDLVCAPDVPIVVADGLFAQHVLARLERRERQLLVVFAAVVAAGDDVDDVDVVPAQEPLVIRLDLRNAELLRARGREIAVEIAKHDNVTERGAREARQVRRCRPAPSTDDPDPKPLGQSPTPGSSGRSTQRRSRCERSTALMISCTRALCAKFP